MKERIILWVIALIVIAIVYYLVVAVGFID